LLLYLIALYLLLHDQHNNHQNLQDVIWMWHALYWWFIYWHLSCHSCLVWDMFYMLIFSGRVLLQLLKLFQILDLVSFCRDLNLISLVNRQPPLYPLISLWSTDNSAHHLGRDRWKVRESPSLALGSLGLGGGWYGGGGGNGGSPGHCLFTIGPHKFEFPWKLSTWINPLSIQNLNPIIETAFNPIHPSSLSSPPLITGPRDMLHDF
jgi:hypothetical protein